ncbi:MAG TPA: protein-disulfide reductase DsbD domain-containing protein, partial [Opitutaceae bacterium]|nr:protein-disulfide reductase DsbD domain-containing protein [Opitutaceae bacterium]
MISRLIALVLISAAVLQAAPVRSPHVDAELVPEVTSIKPGQPFTVALRLKMEQHWHTYWQNPGDSGLATSIDWKLPEGFKAGPIQWPAPSRLPISTLVNYGYEGEVLLLTEITPPATLSAGTTVDLAARADWLVCQEVCMPGGADLKATLPVTADAPKADDKWKQAFAETRKNFPQKSDAWKVKAEHTANGYKLTAEPVKPTAIWPGDDVYFFASEENVVEPSKPQTVSANGAVHTVELSKSVSAQGKPER